jgi:hypothetical protein
MLHTTVYLPPGARYYALDQLKLHLGQPPQSPDIQHIKHRILSTLEDLRNLTDIPSHSPAPMKDSFTYTLSLSPDEVLTGDSRKHQKIIFMLTATFHADVCY